MKQKEVTKNLQSVQRTVKTYEVQLNRHPIVSFAQKAPLSDSATGQLVNYMFADGCAWVPMLTIIKGRAKTPQLRDAVRKNILDEIGHRKEAHLTLCLAFMESLGIAPSSEGADLNGAINIARNLSEAQVAGYLLAQETLTPQLFRFVRGLVRSKPNVDLRYLDEHLEVDVDHTRYMLTAVQAVLVTGESVDHIIEGVDLGARTAIGFLDKLYEQVIRVQ